MPIGKHAVNVAAAVEAHPQSREALADGMATEGRKLTMIRVTIVLALVLPAR